MTSHILEQATRASARAETAAGIRIVEPENVDRLVEVARLLDGIWSRDESGSVVPVELLRAMSYAGAPVLAALAGGRVVGAAVGLLGMEGHHVHLHSHVVGVAGAYRSRSVGFALKLRQRSWALQRDIDTMTWTFDPLVAANASFNLSKLGAMGVAYLVDFYGTLTDSFQEGETDRIEIRWDLASDRAVAASEGSRQVEDADRLVGDGAAVILGRDESGSPVMGRAGVSDILLAQIPPDILEMRRTDPGLADAWQKAVRQTVGPAMDAGRRVTGFARPGWYVLRAQ